MDDTHGRRAGFELVSAWDCVLVLLERLPASLDREAWLQEVLDRLVEVTGADRGLVLLSASELGPLTTLAARSRRGPMLPAEQEEISRTIVRSAVVGGEAVVWDRLDGRDLSESLGELEIAMAVAAPLRRRGWHAQPGAGSVLGALYLDFRDWRRQFEPQELRFLAGAALLVGSALDETRALVRPSANVMGLDVLAPSIDELLAPPSMAPLRRDVEASLASDSPLLLVGESGTGKTLLAHAIAEASGRRPVIRAVLGHSDDLNTIASELFGHERGAFSGAIARRPGLVAFADGGTLILDEILNLPPLAQQLLLDLTQFGTYRPLGHAQPEPRRTRCRLIAATNGDLELAIRERRFREDLFFRLAGVSLRLPPLRARRSEIPLLAESFLARLDPSRHWKLSLGFRRVIVSESLAWPGNVRQLESVLRRARDRAVTADPEAEALLPAHLSPADFGLDALPSTGPASAEPSPTPPEPLDLRDPAAAFHRVECDRRALDARERRVLLAALEAAGWVVAQAARTLGVPRTSLVSRLQTLGIERTQKPS